MRSVMVPVLVFILGGCVMSVPDSGIDGADTGLGNSTELQIDAAQDEMAQVETAQDGADQDGSDQDGADQDGAGQDGAPPGPGAPLSALNDSVLTEAEALAAQTRAALGGGTGTPPPADRPARLSDEQNFDAVANRETIESDRVRLEQRRAQFEQVAPTALPERPESIGPNIVAYALSTSHAPGEAIHNRSSLFGRRDGRNCNRYSNANEAQAAFLSAGGPERDRKGLDPDGDGYACGWDPTPFRLANRASD